MVNSASSTYWAGSVYAKYSYSTSKPADVGRVHQTAWFAVHGQHAWGDTVMHFKNCPTNPGSGHAAGIQSKDLLFFPYGLVPNLSPCSANTSCITGIFSGSARMTGLTYLQFKRENSQMTKKAMFHFSHALLFFSFRNVELFEGQALPRCASSSSFSLEDRTMCSVALHPRWWKETFAKWKQVNQLNTSALIRLQGDCVTCRQD